MTQFEMTEKLAEKLGVSLETAKEALEACHWDMLDAALQLERAQPTRAAGEAPASRQPEGRGAGKALRGIGKVLGKLLALGNRNRFEIRRRGQEALLMDMPVTVLVLLLLAAFWPCLVLLVIGLFAGFSYRFSGSELGHGLINHAMDKAADAADKVVDDIRRDK